MFVPTSAAPQAQQIVIETMPIGFDGVAIAVLLLLPFCAFQSSTSAVSMISPTSVGVKFR